MNMAQTQTGALLHNDHVATIQTLQTLEDFSLGKPRSGLRT